MVRLLRVWYPSITTCIDCASNEDCCTCVVYIIIILQVKRLWQLRWWVVEQHGLYYIDNPAFPGRKEARKRVEETDREGERERERERVKNIFQDSGAINNNIDLFTKEPSREIFSRSDRKLLMISLYTSRGGYLLPPAVTFNRYGNAVTRTCAIVYII